MGRYFQRPAPQWETARSTMPRPLASSSRRSTTQKLGTTMLAASMGHQPEDIAVEVVLGEELMAVAIPKDDRHDLVALPRRRMVFTMESSIMERRTACQRARRSIRTCSHNSVYLMKCSGWSRAGACGSSVCGGGPSGGRISGRCSGGDGTEEVAGVAIGGGGTGAEVAASAISMSARRAGLSGSVLMLVGRICASKVVDACIVVDNEVAPAGGREPPDACMRQPVSARGARRGGVVGEVLPPQPTEVDMQRLVQVVGGDEVLNDGADGRQEAIGDECDARGCCGGLKPSRLQANRRRSIVASLARTAGCHEAPSPEAASCQ